MKVISNVVHINTSGSYVRVPEHVGLGSVSEVNYAAVNVPVPVFMPELNDRTLDVVVTNMVEYYI